MRSCLSNGSANLIYKAALPLFTDKYIYFTLSNWNPLLIRVNLLTDFTSFWLLLASVCSGPLLGIVGFLSPAGDFSFSSSSYWFTTPVLLSGFTFEVLLKTWRYVHRDSGLDV